MYTGIVILILMGLAAFIMGMVIFAPDTIFTRIQKVHMRKWAKTLAIVALVLILFWGLSFVHASSARKENMQIYNDLVLYQEVAETTSNEYVRFDFYNKVNEWNSRYQEYLRLEENPWFSWFLHDEFEGTHPIYFELRR